MIITVLVVIFLVVGTAAVKASLPQRVPDEDELPSRVIIDNQKNLPEVKAFLTKYPTATVTVDRSGRLAVDYSLIQQGSQDGISVLRLRVFSDNSGAPQEMYLDCPQGENPRLIYENIVTFIEEGSCFKSP